MDFLYTACLPRTIYTNIYYQTVELIYRLIYKEKRLFIYKGID